MKFEKRVTYSRYNEIKDFDWLQGKHDLFQRLSLQLNRINRVGIACTIVASIKILYKLTS